MAGYSGTPLVKKLGVKEGFRVAAKLFTDGTEDVVRTVAKRTGLVNVKVCAIDEIGSALKLVIPIKNR